MKGYGYALTHLVGQSVNKHFRSTPYLLAPALLCMTWYLSSWSPWATAPGSGLGTFWADNAPILQDCPDSGRSATLLLGRAGRVSPHWGLLGLSLED